MFAGGHDHSAKCALKACLVELELAWGLPWGPLQHVRAKMKISRLNIEVPNLHFFYAGGVLRFIFPVIAMKLATEM